MRKTLSIKHFKKICDQLKKIGGVDIDLIDQLLKSYSKNFKSKSKTRSVLTLKNPIYDMICSYSFETEDFKLSKTDAKYLTIRYFYRYHTDEEVVSKGKHLIFRKRYFLG